MRKKKKFSKIIVVFSVVLILVYTISAFILQFVAGVEVSSTLTTCFYTFWAVEMLSLAGVKARKVKYENTYEENTESEESEDDC